MAVVGSGANPPVRAAASTLAVILIACQVGGCGPESAAIMVDKTELVARDGMESYYEQTNKEFGTDIKPPK